MPDQIQPVALVTGSGRARVGNVIAKYLADRGYHIALHYHSSEVEAIASRDDIRSRGVSCEAFQANVALDEEVTEMTSQIKDRFGRLDVLVTTSSIWGKTNFDEVGSKELHSNFDVNTLRVKS